MVLGGVNGNARGIKGAVIVPHYATGGASNSSGKIQTGHYLLGGDTVLSASPVDLTTDSSGNIDATNQITLVDNSAIYFSGTVIAKELYPTANPEIVVWDLKGTVYRNAGNSTTNLLSIVNPTIINGNTATTWQVSVTTENNIGCLLVQVQGPSDKQVRWVAKIETIELADAGM